jgi:chromosome partitioning protein
MGWYPLMKDAREFNRDLRAYAIINKAFARGSDNTDAADMLREYPEYWTYVEPPIGTRKAFSNAFGGGYAVTEYQPRDAKAIAEMTVLYQYVFHTSSV